MNQVFNILSSLTILMLSPLAAADAGLEELTDAYRIQCGRIVYGNNKSAICFAEKFLERFKTETHLQVATRFKPVKLGTEEIYSTPFCVFSGEGEFKLSTQERANMRSYLMKGGFIVSSPGCSDKSWDRSFRAELKNIFPEAEYELKQIPMTHLIFKTVKNITKLSTKRKTSTHLEGIFIDGRLALVYTLDGVNQARYAKGCCCCGGDEIKQASDLNVNILTYAILY